MRFIYLLIFLSVSVQAKGLKPYPFTQRALPLHVEGTQILDSEGKPFLYLADTAWTLFDKLTEEEAIAYLKTRARQGYTVIQATLLNDGLATPNRYGERPLLNSDRSYLSFEDCTVSPLLLPFKRNVYDHQKVCPHYNPDPLEPNPAYWDRVDRIVEAGAQLGLYFAFLPSVGHNATQIEYNFINFENAERFGEILGLHFRNAPFIWVLGGDRPPRLLDVHDEPVKDGDLRGLFQIMAEGIRRTSGGNQLITYLAGSRSVTISPSFCDQSHPEYSKIFDFELRAGGHSRILVDGPQNGVTPLLSRLLESEAGCRLGPHKRVLKPVVLTETLFEDLPSGYCIQKVAGEKPDWMSDYENGRAAWTAILGGTNGFGSGNHEVWIFYNPKLPELYPASWYTPLHSWQDALWSKGALRMRNLRRLLSARPGPYQYQAKMVLNPQTGQSFAMAATARSGQYALAYSSAGQPLTVNLAYFSRRARGVTGYWFDPRTGELQCVEKGRRFLPQQAVSFTPPTQGKGQDWVLLLDRVGKGYAGYPRVRCEQP